jgi:hypothetical protein
MLAFTCFTCSYSRRRAQSSFCHLNGGGCSILFVLFRELVSIWSEKINTQLFRKMKPAAECLSFGWLPKYLLSLLGSSINRGFKMMYWRQFRSLHYKSFCVISWSCVMVPSVVSIMWHTLPRTVGINVLKVVLGLMLLYALGIDVLKVVIGLMYLFITSDHCDRFS